MKNNNYYCVLASFLYVMVIRDIDTWDMCICMYVLCTIQVHMYICTYFP